MRDGSRVCGIVQARLGSSRLLRKSLADVAGAPLLGRVLERARASTLLDEVVVATTEDEQDDELVEFASEAGAQVVRGSADDVLDRVHCAAEEHGASIVVRLTADDPFKDPEVIDRVIRCLLDDARLDYASNTLRPSYPVGIDVEALTIEALRTAAAEASTPFDREHVTPYVIGRPERFRLASIETDPNLSHLRWTIDYGEDLEFACAVYKHLAPDTTFGFERIAEAIMHDQGLRLLQSRAIAAAEAGLD